MDKRTKEGRETPDNPTCDVCQVSMIQCGQSGNVIYFRCPKCERTITQPKPWIDTTIGEIRIHPP